MIGLMRAAIFEAMTLLVLFCVAMPLKYMAGLSQAGSAMGSVHGLAFTVIMRFVSDLGPKA